MAPKVPEKQHNHQQQHHHQKPIQSSSTNIKHSTSFHISALTLCHNKRLKLKRSKYGEYLRSVNTIKRSTAQQNFHKTEVRRKKLNSLKPDVTIDLLSDSEDQNQRNDKRNNEKQTVIPKSERLSLERAKILGLMPIEKLIKPPPLVSILTNYQHSLQQKQQMLTQQKQHLPQNVLMVPAPLQLQQQPRKRKSKPQKRRSLPTPTKNPIIIQPELIVLSDDSNDIPMPMSTSSLSQSYSSVLQPDEYTVTCSTSSQIACLPQQNTMQVDEEVTISLVPRSLNATTCANRSSLNSSSSATPQQDIFPMLPDETTVQTVIANRIYELSLTKLREGLASCGIPEFADGHQRTSTPKRKGLIHQPPMVSPPQAPISLKLSSDLSISLISDDEDDINNCRHDPILNPAFLQKLPVNVSIAPVPPSSNHATEHRKLKFG